MHITMAHHKIYNDICIHFEEFDAHLIFVRPLLFFNDLAALFTPGFLLDWILRRVHFDIFARPAYFRKTSAKFTLYNVTQFGYVNYSIRTLLIT